MKTNIKKKVVHTVTPNINNHVPEFQRRKIQIAEQLAYQNVAIIEQHKEIIKFLKLIAEHQQR